MDIHPDFTCVFPRTEINNFSDDDVAVEIML